METVTDLIKQALRNEIYASAFFTKAAEMTKDDEARMLFIELGGMEDDHANELVDKLKNTPCSEGLDMAAYLKELESSTDPVIAGEVLATIENGDAHAVLRLAIESEERAVQTYTKLADEVVDLEVKSYCLELVRQEKTHASMLTKHLRSMDMDAEDRPGL
ncbi:MAG: ferritin family protein [Magnetococcales bacterium]|nr:ferritin family protein [Magnetococcales bacterium]NGZ06630.1 ferritin family protein [Magnetococcales bacterium]